MLSEQTTRWFILCGAVAALIAGILTGGLAFFGLAGLTRLNLIDGAIFLVLALGIFNRSRTCAVLALVYDGVNQYLRIARGGEVLSGLGLIIALAFGVAYVLGVVGTFEWHARRARVAQDEHIRLSSG